MELLLVVYGLWDPQRERSMFAGIRTLSGRHPVYMHGLQFHQRLRSYQSWHFGAPAIRERCRSYHCYGLEAAVVQSREEHARCNDCRDILVNSSLQL